MYRNVYIYKGEKRNKYLVEDMQVKELIELLSLEDWERDEVFYRDLLAGYFVGIDSEEELYVYANPATFELHPDEGRLILAQKYDEIKKTKEKIEYGKLEIPVIYLEDIDVLTLKDWWIEWRTSGIVYSKVLGKKKSYRFALPVPDVIAVKFMDIPLLFERINVPCFEVAIDTVSIKVEKIKKKIRRFWQWRGKVEIWFVGRTFDGKKVERKVGEITVDWKGHRELVERAEEMINKLMKVKRELEEKRLYAKGKEKAKITREIRKIEKALQFWLKARNRHYKCALKIWGWIGDYKIKRIVAYKKRKKVENNEIVKGFYVPKKQIQKIRFGNQEIAILPLKYIDFNTLRTKHRCIVAKEYQFYGRHGKLNHRLKLLAIPQRKLSVKVLAQAREQVFRKLVKTRKHLVEVIELNADEKVWIVKPIDNVARFVIINKDHKREGLDRILVHLDNQALIFTHKL